MYVLLSLTRIPAGKGNLDRWLRPSEVMLVVLVVLGCIRRAYTGDPRDARSPEDSSAP